MEEDPATAERLGEVPVAVIDKGKGAGSHLLSGAVVNPRALRTLFRDRPELDAIPTYGEVPGEGVYLLTKGAALRIPPPPTMRNHGHVILSVAELGRWLAERAEEGGAMLLTETTAQQLLVDHGSVRGIRTGAEEDPLVIAESLAPLGARLVRQEVFLVQAERPRRRRVDRSDPAQRLRLIVFSLLPAEPVLALKAGLGFGSRGLRERHERHAAGSDPLGLLGEDPHERVRLPRPGGTDHEPPVSESSLHSTWVPFAGRFQ